MADQRAPRTSHLPAFNSMCSLTLIRSLRHKPPNLLAFLCAPAARAAATDSVLSAHRQAIAHLEQTRRGHPACTSFGALPHRRPCASRCAWFRRRGRTCTLARRVVLHCRVRGLPPLYPTLCPRRVLPHLLRARHFQSHSNPGPCSGSRQRQQRQRRPRRQRYTQNAKRRRLLDAYI